uniref:UBX domain-containing protein 4 n=1 Tax=Scophthalmus maximus TaxID=52904 RepID=A0A8D3DNI1_SCOMX
MLWFEGTIAEAINSAKQRGFVFVVVITGADEQSAQLMSSWEDDRVSEAALHCCVAIKVDAKSEACVQFSQIYPVVCIPSSFFIGENGIPLEVIAGSVSAEELMKRINRVKQVWPHILDCMQFTYSLYIFLFHTHTHIHEHEKCAQFTKLLEHGLHMALIFSHLRNPMPPYIKKPAIVKYIIVKVNVITYHFLFSFRLNKKLEERREQRIRGEEENEIKKEMERRKTGKDTQDYKRKQEDDKTKRLLEERNREKTEEKAARERVKLQIALDRADRAARYAKTQVEERSSKEALLQARQAEQEARKEALVRQRSTIARIQFRLPDGSSFTNQFPAQSTLQEARHFAVQEVGNRYGNFSLATMFPRREFTSEDLNKTLLELELAPSASIVLLPYSGRPANSMVQSSGGGVWAVLGTILYPLLAVWRFLSTFLFTAPPPPGPASRGPAPQSGSYTNSTPSSDKDKRETPSKHTLEKQPKEFKKEGKVCSLRTQEDSEDENNTWNGNSTQQM